MGVDVVLMLEVAVSVGISGVVSQGGGKSDSCTLTREELLDATEEERDESRVR